LLDVISNNTIEKRLTVGASVEYYVVIADHETSVGGNCGWHLRELGHFAGVDVERNDLVSERRGSGCF